MDDEERKKKLEAGKERLAAFRRKKAKRKRRPEETAGSGDAAQNIGIDGNSAEISSSSDVQSLTEDSDQLSYSDTSGDEWSEKESELHSAVYYQAKLSHASQRVAELEEMVEGKQLALDRLVKENQALKSQQTTDVHQIESNDRMIDVNENGNKAKSDGPEKARLHDLHMALVQRDAIIQQLTVRLRATMEKDVPDCYTETQNLAKQVALLQQQLMEAGEALRGQMNHHSLSSKALQEAKAEILSLQVKLQKKDDILTNVKQDLMRKTEEVLNLGNSCKELKERKEELQKELLLVKEDRNSLMIKLQDQSDVDSLRKELEKLESDYNSALSEMSELKKHNADLEAIAVEKTANRKDFEELQSHVEELTSDNAKLEFEVTELKSCIIELETTCSQFQKEAEQKQFETDRMRNKINDQQGEIVDMRTQLELLQDENLETSEKLNQLLENKEEEFANELKARIDEIQALKNEHQMYKETIEKLHEEIHILKKETLENIAGKEESSTVKIDSSTQSNVTDLVEMSVEQEHFETCEKVRHFEPEQAALQYFSLNTGAASVADGGRVQIQRQHDTNSNSEHLLIDEQLSNKSLPEKIQILRSLLINAQTELESKHVNLQQLNNEYDNLKLQIESLLKVQEEFSELKTNFDKQKHCYREDVKNLQDMLDLLKVDFEKLQSENSKLIQEKMDLENTIQTMADEKVSLEENVETLRSEKQCLMLKVESAENDKVSECKRLEEECERLQIQTVSQEEMLNQYREKIDHSSKQTEKLKEELDNLQASIEEITLKKQELIQEMQKQKEASECEINHLKSELGQVHEELNRTVTTEQQQTSAVQLKLDTLSEELMKLRTEVASSEAQILNEQKLKNEYKNENTNLSNELKILLGELDQAQTTIQKIELEKNKLLDDNAKANAEVQKLTVECENLRSIFQNQEENLTDEINHLEISIEEARKEVVIEKIKHEEARHSFEMKYEHSQNEVDRLQAEINEARSAISHLETEKQQELQRYETNVAESAAEIEHLKKELSENTLELDAMQEKYNATQSEYEQFKIDSQKYIDSLKKKVEFVNEETEQMLAHSERKQAGLEASLAATCEELDRLKIEATNYKTSFESQLLISSEQLAESQTKLESMEQLIDDLNKRNNSNMQNKAEIELQSENLACEIRSIQSLLDVSRAEVNSLQSQISSLKEKLENEETSKIELQQMCDALTDDYNQAVKKTDELQSELENHKEIIMHIVESSCDEMEGVTFTNFRNGVKILEMNITRMKMEMERLLLLVDDRNLKITEMESAAAKKNEDTEIMSDYINTLKSELTEVKVLLDEKSDEIMQKDVEISNIHAIMDSVKKEKEILKINFDSCLEEMQSKIAEQETEIRNLKSQLVENTKNSDDEDDIKAAYETHVSVVEDKLEKTQAELEQLKIKFNSVLDDKQNLLSAAENHIAELEDTSNGLENENARLKEQMERASEIFQTEKSDMQRMHETQIAELEDNCRTLEANVNRLQSQISEQVKTFEQQKNELEENYENQLSDIEDRCRILDMENGKLKHHMEEMAKDHKQEKEHLHRMFENQIIELEDRCRENDSKFGRCRQKLEEQLFDSEQQKSRLEQQVQELLDKYKNLEQNRSVDHEMAGTRAILGGDITVERTQGEGQEQEYVAEKLSLRNKSLYPNAAASEVTEDRTGISIQTSEIYLNASKQHVLCTTEGSQTQPNSDVKHIENLEEKVKVLSNENTALKAQTEAKRIVSTAEPVILSRRYSYPTSDDILALRNTVSDLKTTTESLSHDNNYITIELQKEREKLHAAAETIEELKEGLRSARKVFDEMKTDHQNELDQQRAESEQEIQELRQKLVAWEMELIQRRQLVDGSPNEQITAQEILSSGLKIDSMSSAASRLEGESGSEKAAELVKLVADYEEKVGCLSLELTRLQSEYQTSKDVHEAEVADLKKRLDVSDEVDMAGDNNAFKPESLGEFHPELPEMVPQAGDNLSFNEDFEMDMELLVSPKKTAKKYLLKESTIYVTDVSTQTEADELIFHQERHQVCDHFESESLQTSPELGKVKQDEGVCTVEPIHLQESMIKPDACTQTEDPNNFTQQDIDQAKELLRRQLTHEKDMLEESYVKELRMQKVELTQTYEEEKEKLKTDLEQRLHQKTSAMNREKQQQFIKALRKVRKQLEAKHQKEIEKVKQQASMETPIAEQNQIIDKLRKENQELAEARDALLKQVNMTQNHQTQLQDELQIVLSEKGPLSGDLSDVHTASPRSFTSSSEQFMEELENLSQQSLQDVPLEWEMSEDGIFDNNEPCPRCECIKLKQKYDSLVELFNKVQGTQDSAFVEESQMHLLKITDSSKKSSRSRMCSDEQDCDESMPAGNIEHAVAEIAEMENPPGTIENDFMDGDLRQRISQLESENHLLEKKLSDQLDIFCTEKQHLKQKCETLEINLNQASLSGHEVEQELMKQNDVLQQSLSQLKKQLDQRAPETLQTEENLDDDQKMQIQHLTNLLEDKEVLIDQLQKQLLEMMANQESTKLIELVGEGSDLVLGLGNSDIPFQGKELDRVEHIIPGTEPKQIVRSCQQDKILNNQLSLVCLQQHGDDSSSADNRIVDQSFNFSDNISCDFNVQNTELIEELHRMQQKNHELSMMHAEEKALLQEELERQKLMNQLVQKNTGCESETVFSTEMVELRKELAVLREFNKVLSFENKCFYERMRDQEHLVLCLKEELDREDVTSKDQQNVFSRQLLLLQKQREQLLQEIENSHSQQNQLASVLGEKTILEETLRREKQMLLEKLVQFEDLQQQLNQRGIHFEHFLGEQRRLEQLLLLKDENEKQLMRQKRLLQEELFEIEAKLREREAILEEEKTRLLREVKEKNVTIRKLESLNIGEPSDAGLDLRIPRVRGRRASMGKLEEHTPLQLGGSWRSGEPSYEEAIEILRNKLKMEHEVKVAKLEESHASQMASFWNEQVKKLESLRSQYETQMDSLRQELAAEKEQKHHNYLVLQDTHKEAIEKLRENVDEEKRKQLDTVLDQLQKIYAAKIDQIEKEHREDIYLQVQAMRLSAEQVYNGQLELFRADVEEKHAADVDSLKKQHKEEINRLKEEFSKKDSSALLESEKLDTKLFEQYQVLIERISSELETKVLKNEEGDKTEINDVCALLERQKEDISQLHSQILSEHLQQTQLVEQLQTEMESLKKKYDEEVSIFQTQIQHYIDQEKEREKQQEKQQKELNELRTYYEKHVEEMEKSFEQEISTLQAKYEEQMNKLQIQTMESGESKDSSQNLDESDSTEYSKVREYVHRTTNLTVISDSDESISETQKQHSIEALEAKISGLEDVIHEREKQIGDVEVLLEQERERTSQLVEETKLLKDQLNESQQLIDRLKNDLSSKDQLIAQLQDEKTDREKDLQKISQDLSESVEREKDLQSQIEDIRHCHKEALIDLRQELEHEAKMETETMQSEFKVQMEIELKRQAAELANAVPSTETVTKPELHVLEGDTTQIVLTTRSFDSTSDDVNNESTQTTGANVCEVGGSVVSDNDLTELKKDYTEKIEKLTQELEALTAEKDEISKKHQSDIENMQLKLTQAQENYNKLMQDIENGECHEVEDMIRDKIDVELELAKNLMQQEFDETLEAERKRFMECHRKMMDDFMEDRMKEAEELKKNQDSKIKEQQDTILEYEEKLKQLENVHKEEIEKLQQATLLGEQQSVCVQTDYSKDNDDDDVEEKIQQLQEQHEKTVNDMKKEFEEKYQALQKAQDDALEAAAMDTDRVKSELEAAHQQELHDLEQQLQEKYHNELKNLEQHHQQEIEESKQHTMELSQLSTQSEHMEEMREVSEVVLPVHTTSLLQKVELNSTLDSDMSITEVPTETKRDYTGSDLEEEDHPTPCSSPDDLMVTRSFADVVRGSPPSESTEASNEKDEKIRNLEAMVKDLSERLQQYDTEEEVLIGRRQRESAEDSNLVSMLKSDLDRISAERNAVQKANDHLLQTLSDSVKTCMAVEERINRNLSKILNQSAPQQQAEERPRAGGWRANYESDHDLAQDRRLLEVARRSSSPNEHGDVNVSQDSSTLAETSILSLTTDEGLDMSQRFTDSIFTGPDLEPDGEEIVSEARLRLQESVNRLLDMIEQTTQQLHDMKKTQQELMEALSSRSQDLEAAQHRCEELEDRLGSEISAKEFLVLELSKSEGLISGFTSEHEMLQQKIEDLEEKRQSMAQQLELTQNRLYALQKSQDEVEQMRTRLERQQAILQENVGEENQEVDSSEQNKADPGDDDPALLSEVTMLSVEKQKLEEHTQHQIYKFQARMQDLESVSEEQERHHEDQLKECRQEIEDLKMKLEKVERQFRANKQFLDDQTLERELERDEFQRDIDKLRQQLHDKAKQGNTEDRLQMEVQDLTEQLQNRIEIQEEILQRAERFQKDLQDKELAAKEMKEWAGQLEQNLEEKEKFELQLKQKIERLESQLAQQPDIELSETVMSLTADSDEFGSPNILSPVRRTPAQRIMTLEDELKKYKKTEEDLMLEKDALQRTVQEQLLQISALRNQLDDMRHYGSDTNTSHGSHTAELREQLQSARDALEKKEQEVSVLEEELERMKKQFSDRETEINKLLAKLEKDAQPASPVTEDIEKLRKLEHENETLKNQLDSFHENSDGSDILSQLADNLLKEKNSEIDELSEQINQLQVALEAREASGEGSEAIEKLREQLRMKDESIAELQASIQNLTSEQFSGDVSLTEIDRKLFSVSLTGKATLQQELEESAAQLKTFEEKEAQTEEKEKDESVDLSTLQAEISELRTLLSQAETAREELIKTLQAAEEEKTDIQSQLVEKEREITQLQEDIEVKHSTVEQMTAQIDSLQEEINSLTNFQNELQQDFDTVQSMLENKQREMDSLSQEFTDSLHPVPLMSNEEIEQLEKEVNELRKSLQDKKNIIEEKEEELYELNEKLELQESLSAELAKVRQTLDETEEHLKQEQQLREQISKQYEELEQQSINKTDREKEDQKIKLADAENKITDIENKLADTENKLTEMQVKLAETETVLKETQESLAEKEEIIKEKEIFELLQKVEEDHQEDLQQAQQLRESEQQDICEELKSQISQLEQKLKENKDLQENLEQKLEEKNEELQEKSKELQEKIEQLQEKSKELPETSETLEKELQEKNEELEENIKEQQNLEAEKEKYSALVKSYTDLQEKLESQELLCDEYATERTELETKIKLKEEQIEKLYKEKTEIEEKLKAKEQECIQLQRELQEIRTQEHVQSQQSEDIESRTSQEFVSQTVLLEKEENIGMLSSELTDLSRQLKEAQERVDQASAMLAEREAQITQLQAELLVASNGSQDIADLKSKVREKEEQITNLKVSLTLSEQDLTSKNERLEQLEAKCKSLTEELTEARQQHSFTESTTRDLSNFHSDIRLARSESEPALDSWRRSSSEFLSRMNQVEALTMQQKMELAEKNRQLRLVRDQMELWLAKGQQDQGDVKALIMKLTTELKNVSEPATEPTQVEKERELRQSQREIKTAERTLQLQQTEITELRSSNENLRHEWIERDVEVSRSEQHILHLKSKLRKAQSSLAELGNQSANNNNPPPDGNESGDFAMPYMVDDEEVEKLKQELTDLRNENKILRNTAPMSTQEFVKKIQDLRNELTTEHTEHIRNIQHQHTEDLEAQLTSLQLKHDTELQHLQHQHQLKGEQALALQKQELEKQHKTEINSMLIEHQREIDRLRSDYVVHDDASVVERCDRLRTEVSSTELLDGRLQNRLSGSVFEVIGQNESDVSLTESSSMEFLPDDSISTKLQAIMTKVHKHGLSILTLSEMQYLQRHMSQEEIGADIDMQALIETWERERQTFVSTINTLKELLSKVKASERLTDTEERDWRGDLLLTLCNLFTKEREILLAELHTYIASHPEADKNTVIGKLERRIQDQESLHRSAIDQVLNADRQSLLSEIEELKSALSKARLDKHDQQQKLTERFSSKEEESLKKERQLQRQIQVLEFKLQQEKVIEDDLRNSLELENKRVNDLTSQLTREKNQLLDLQSEISSLQIQLSKARDSLEREQSRFISVTDALEDSREKNEHLLELLDAERRKVVLLESQVADLKTHNKDYVEKESRFVEQLRNELTKEQERRIDSVRHAEIEKAAKTTAQQELEIERRRVRSIQNDYDGLLAQLKSSLESERLKCDELSGNLERERQHTSQLESMLEAEKSARQQMSHQEQSSIENYLSELQEQKTLVEDLKRALTREKQNSSSLSNMLDMERASSQHDIEEERNVSRRLKRDIDTFQMEKLELKRHLDLERERARAFQMQLEEVQHDMKTIKQRENEYQKQTVSELKQEKRRQRELEREKEELNIQLHEIELEGERLKEKLRDTEMEVDQSRDREQQARIELERLRHEFERSRFQKSPKTPIVAERATSPPESREFSFSSPSVSFELLKILQQRLEYLALRLQEEVNASPQIQEDLATILSQINSLQHSHTDQIDGVSDSVIENTLEHNNQLTTFLSQVCKEKEQLRANLKQLEDELVHYRRRERHEQINQENGGLSEDRYMHERVMWANERLSLQMNLDTAEREIEHLQRELRVLRNEQNAVHIVDTDREKMQRLYGRLLRSESFRKALIYQKRYLLLLLGGYQDCEQETLMLIAQIGGYPSDVDVNRRRRHPRMFMIFRSAARVIIAICRMRYMVRKWRRATRVGSPVVGGRINQQYGYVGTNNSFSPPRPLSSSVLSSSSQSNIAEDRYSHSSYISHARTTLETTDLPNGDLQRPETATADGLARRRLFTTPPTKDPSLQTHTAVPASSSARRQLLRNLENPPSTEGDVSVPQDETTNDEFIQRLENLQTRLGRFVTSSKTDTKYSRHSSWR